MTSAARHGQNREGIITMDLPELIAALSRPEAYPHPAPDVQVRHTHISVVFLAGPAAYKVKKPVRLAFLDFSTLEKRRHFCEVEVRLNRRLALAVYRGVVPITREPSGLKVGGQGEVIEWAVRMDRLPEEATLEKRLERGEVGQPVLQALARRVATFHAGLPPCPDSQGFAGFAAVARNARENLTQAAPQVGLTLSRAVHDRLTTLLEEELTARGMLIEDRARRGVPRDTHGDLHLDHVYLLGDDLVIIDCIEFDARFRIADRVSDMAFLVMDLLFHGRPDLADLFADAYFQATADAEGRALLPLYTSYRAAVRAKVEGLELTETEVPEAERSAALLRARAHWLLALGVLETPAWRPALVLVAGLPGTGKSTLAGALGRQAGFEVIRSDAVRKDLAGDLQRAERYSPDWNRRTYAECLRRAEAFLFEGRRVLVDANFRRREQRQPFQKLAARSAVPALLLVCRAVPDVIRQRLQQRQGDVSDADWSVYQQLASEWEEPTPPCPFRNVPTGGPCEVALAAALDALRELHLLS
jgi:aminoglycoside phosphotransferase family enzyme/predicted kinase